LGQDFISKACRKITLNLGYFLVTGKLFRDCDWGGS